MRLALLFLAIALVAALFGFTTLSGTAYTAAQIVFFIFLMLFVISLLAGRGSPRGNVM